MNFQQRGLFSPEMTGAPYALQQLEVFNWGSFDRYHRAEFDPQGTALVGATGSGKTTLIDALMTLLTAQPKYNLASTGGQSGDRNLMSYLRGVSGAGNGSDTHKARSGKTVTGISARFSNAQQTLQIGAIFWLDSASTASSDRKDIWFVTEQDDQSLRDWLRLHQEGGARALKQFGKESAKLTVHNTKKAYLAQLHRFFEVGDNAFALLNRAVGLKQLDSVNAIFRELVLEDRAAFGRAAEVAEAFETLVAIRGELKTAEKQQRSLEPVARAYKKYQHLETRLDEQRRLRELIPLWFARLGHTLWGERAEALVGEVEALERQMAQVKQEVDTLTSEADDLKNIYLQSGGNDIKQLEKRIETQEQLTKQKQRNVQEYQRSARLLELDPVLTPQAFTDNKRRSEGQVETLKRDIEKRREEVYRLGAENIRHQESVAEKRAEITKIEARPGSNVPSHYGDFRTVLAAHLGLDEEVLPFVAELIEVKLEERAWRGAIERAIGAHRLRLLVPPAHIQTALSWVNSRDNRLHVRLLEAIPSPRAPSFEDGFVRKLRFKEHPLSSVLKAFLVGIDRHCVASPEVLRATPHAMTVQGLMSGKPGRFEKLDDKKRSLSQGWMTGFDNRDRLTSLRQDLQEAEAALTESERVLEAGRKALEQTEKRFEGLERLLELDFESINSPAAEAELVMLQERLKALTDPASAVSKARYDYEQTAQRLEERRSAQVRLNKDAGGSEEQLNHARRKQRQALERIGPGLASKQIRLAESHLLAVSMAQLEELDKLEQIEQKRADGAFDKRSGELNDLSRKLVSLMGAAQSADTGDLVTHGVDLRDVPAYLSRLETLNKEALPEKERRFLNYLNESSGQGVTQILRSIREEVARIEARIEDLNDTLQRVDLQPERYLRLETRTIVHERLRALQRAQKSLNVAEYKEDRGESKYGALERVVALLRDAAESKRNAGSRALLDPRYRLEFRVSIMHRNADGPDDVIETRTGSQGGSGGEKEMIAIYILTASLSYALRPEGLPRPLFSTIVLDEAFSKSSQVAAERTIGAIRAFGLHPLFVTPNKELQLLQAHTRAALLVHRKGASSTLTPPLSWEEIGAHSKGRQARSVQGHARQEQAKQEHVEQKQALGEVT